MPIGSSCMHAWSDFDCQVVWIRGLGSTFFVITKLVPAIDEDQCLCSNIYRSLWILPIAIVDVMAKARPMYLYHHPRGQLKILYPSKHSNTQFRNTGQRTYPPSCLRATGGLYNRACRANRYLALSSLRPEPLCFCHVKGCQFAC